MNTLFHKWRGLQVAVAIAATTFAAYGAVEVKTLGGGPNLLGPARSGMANGDTLTIAKFNNPSAVAIDTNGNLYIADRGNNKVRKITRPGAADSLTSTFASRLPAPVGVAVDASNRVYVVTAGDGKLRVFSSEGSLLRTVSGLMKPTALALGPDGNVYITELVGNLEQVKPDGSVTLILSGLNKPQGVAFLRNGLLAVSDTGNNAISIVNPSNGTNTVIAGGSNAGFNGAGFNDGSGAQARFNHPWNIALAPNGTLVVADRKNHRVRVIDMLSTSYTVSTLFGIDRTQWARTFPGWADGDASIAAAREPAGVTVDQNGTVFDTELAWHLIRQATGGALTGTNGTGNATNVVVVGTNVVTVIGTNVISFGFESGEASSDFVGAAGQSFYAPVTLAIAPGQKIYSFQMSLSSTGETGVVLDPFRSGFVSLLKKPLQIGGVTYEVPINQNYEFLNSSINLLGVGWITRYTHTNLYDTLAQDLVKISSTKNTRYLSSDGKVILGAYRLPIPSSSPNGSTFRIALRNPSGTADGISQPVPLMIPTNGSLGAGAPNTVKRVTLASRQYIVGDSTPFRWFNAGDFGDTTLASSDVSDLFQSAVYMPYLNTPIRDSDLFDSLDASDGSSGTVSFGDDASINTITTGDGNLAVDDVWVTFRRSLDPTLKWFARYWSNGIRQVVEVPNSLQGGFGVASAPLATKSLSRAKSIARPTASLSADDRMTTPSETFQLPVRISVSDGYPVRVMMLNVTVEAMDGSPALTSPIQFQTAPGFHSPELTDSHGLNNLAAAWLDQTVSGISGDSVLGLLTIQIPANAGPRAAYRVHFDHFSASPNGMALFDAQASVGLLLLSDRSASTWGDGIADAWRLRYFGSISSPDSASGADADGDGVINSDEYVNGTDPTDILSN